MQSHAALVSPDGDCLSNRPRDWRSMTRTIAHYERIEQIGEGTYGQVYRARCKDSNEIVALKKIRVHHGGYWGMPPTVIREIKILKRLRHPNLVQMVEVVSSKGVEHLDEEDEVSEKHKSSKNDRVVDAREGFKGNLFLVLEYVSHDLTGLMDVAYRFSEVQVKCIFRQLLEALHYMHENKYVHRDIKSSNILIDRNFRVKLADFGLARCLEPPILDKIHDRGNSQKLTNKVITLWYRPPELLLGATKYGTSVDIWSAGCILAELILGKPLFTGKSEMDQLKLIFEMLGTPTPETWEGFEDLELLRTGKVSIESKNKAKLRPKYQSKISAPALNLVEKLLELDPQKRLTASRALNSRYFLAEPRAPERPEDLGTLEGHFHERQTKKMRKEAKTLAEKAKQTALEGGCSEKDAQEEFDATYREIVAKVAKEGIKIESMQGTNDDETYFRTEKSLSKQSVNDKSVIRAEERNLSETLGMNATDQGAHDGESYRKDRKFGRHDRKDERKREIRDRDRDRGERKRKKRREGEGRRKRRPNSADYGKGDADRHINDADQLMKSSTSQDRDGDFPTTSPPRSRERRMSRDIDRRSSRRRRDRSMSIDRHRSSRESRDGSTPPAADDYGQYGPAGG
eukprot:scaffold25626_cov137-Cylindrotheca_fusiformis.AAC.3